MLTIDNIKISDLGISILQGSYKALVEYPKLKKVDSNDWAEYDGLEVDLESPRLDKRELNIPMYFKDKGQFGVLADFLLQNTYRIWHFTELQRSFKLRIIGFSDIKINQGVCEVKVNLVDDFPFWADYSYKLPKLPQIFADYGFYLDDVNFTKYGISPLYGSESGLKGSKKGKKVLEVGNLTMQGVQVGNQPIKSKSRDGYINCFMKLPIDKFWQTYYAFLFDLTRPNERTLTAFGEHFKCYYLSADIQDFEIQNNEVWCEFKLNLKIL